MGSQQDTSAAQPNAQSTWSLQMAAQANASASHKKVLPLFTFDSYISKT
jgi:hypothetical protein